LYISLINNDISEINSTYFSKEEIASAGQTASELNNNNNQLLSEFHLIIEIDINDNYSWFLIISNLSVSCLPVKKANSECTAAE